MACLFYINLGSVKEECMKLQKDLEMGGSDPKLNFGTGNRYPTTSCN